MTHVCWAGVWLGAGILEASLLVCLWVGGHRLFRRFRCVLALQWTDRHIHSLIHSACCCRVAPGPLPYVCASQPGPQGLRPILQAAAEGCERQHGVHMGCGIHLQQPDPAGAFQVLKSLRACRHPGRLVGRAQTSGTATGFSSSTQTTRARINPSKPVPPAPASSLKPASCFARATGHQGAWQPPVRPQTPRRRM